ncbi:hypothetical protein NLX71_14885 [Paenibacillus sp. MZ04-78.2]|uniref:hypothetical protein n=1 Tax=Paenibacillus sp. MZ04-78.2 TaxID=2962034 RepID=UPI0020B7B0CA|nr:hypothetical protein [Paenibacillus sp. MZ04-78.2]MCP3774577.1 hypothetical protein [Paenibacillus sp. MZ04-78.2]
MKFVKYVLGIREILLATSDKERFHVITYYFKLHEADPLVDYVVRIEALQSIRAFASTANSTASSWIYRVRHRLVDVVIEDAAPHPRFMLNSRAAALTGISAINRIAPMFQRAR